MIELLASMTLSCPDAAWIIQGIRNSEMRSALQSDLVIEVIQATDPDCDLGAALEANPR